MTDKQKVEKSSSKSTNKEKAGDTDLQQLIKKHRKLDVLPPVPWLDSEIRTATPPPVSKELELSLNKKFQLPLTTRMTTLVSLNLEMGGSVVLLCWQRAGSMLPKFTVSLWCAYVVNNITESGPCIYVISREGEFEFQCKDYDECIWWTNLVVAAGAHHLHFSDIYDIVRTIGSGSFATVYLGQHRLSGEEIVIKAVRKSRSKKSNAYTEIEVLRKMAHPFVIRLYAAYEEGDHICLVLEYVRGGELFTCLTSNGPLTEFNARAAMHRVLLALQYMHANGIVHRDLKTENLILEHPACPWAVKLIDYGLASTLNKESMRMRCGSPGYVAPEILQDKPYSTKVDVFSAGVILYALLTGSPPFGGQDVGEIIKKNLRCRLSFPGKYFNSVGLAAQDLLRWMCAKDPNDRCSAFEALSHPWLQPIPPSPRGNAIYVDNNLLFGGDPIYALGRDASPNGKQMPKAGDSAIRRETSTRCVARCGIKSVCAA